MTTNCTTSKVLNFSLMKMVREGFVIVYRYRGLSVSIVIVITVLLQEKGGMGKEGKRKRRGMHDDAWDVMKMRLVITNLGPRKSHAILDTCHYILH